MCPGSMNDSLTQQYITQHYLINWPEGRVHIFLLIDNVCLVNKTDNLLPKFGPADQF